MSEQPDQQNPRSIDGSAAIEIDGRIRRLSLTAGSLSGEWHAILDGQSLKLNAALPAPGVLSLLINGRSYRCVLEEAPDGNSILLHGRRFPFAQDDPRSLSARRKKEATTAGKQSIKAPMPGRIVRVLVGINDQVEAQQGIVVIEAMKMQNELRAARSGRIAELRVEAGATVTAGQLLVLIE